MIKVFCDDGSTAIKLCWYDKQHHEPKTLISQNTFTEGWKPVGFASDQIYNYEVDGLKYSFSKASAEVIPTTNIDFQYRTENLLSVHHALQLSGIKPQEIELWVTLPISEYYTNHDAQENTFNIQRKISNLQRSISLNKRQVFTFGKIRVYPESVPAVVSALQIDNVHPLEQSLVVDLGGTTLDCGVIEGQFDSIAKISSDAGTGVSLVIRHVQDALLKADTLSNYYVADTIIREMMAGNDVNIFPLINNVEYIATVKTAFEISRNRLIEKVIQHVEQNYRGFHRIYLTGGGAEYLYTAFNAHWSTLKTKIKKLETPQLALVKALAEIGKHQ
jgi:plasmid segregation protein ParM